MLFPIADVGRQKLATDTFREAIRIDQSYAGGYAGAAHSLATLAILAPGGNARDGFLAEAQDMAGKALELDPTDAWTQSAAAWVAFAGRAFGDAVRLSDRALSLAPRDGHVLDFHAIIALLTGDFAQARLSADPDRERESARRRLAHRNIYGVASFHLKDFEAAIASFQMAADLGDPVSELSLTFLAASHQAAGQSAEAAEYLRELVDAWPGFRPDLALAKFYQHPAHVDQVVQMLVAAGWDPSQ